MKPPLLHGGDKVAIAAPARKISPAELQSSVDLIKSWGLEVVIPAGIFGSYNQWSGTDAQRAAQLQTLLDDESISAILCARGGYGTVRIIDKIDFSKFRLHPKWIVGYSDATVLHSHIACISGIATLHATMPINIPADACRKKYSSTATMQQILFHGAAHYRLDNTPSTCSLNRNGTARAVAVGGNLSVLYSLLHSPSDINTDGKILVIEDLDEYLYHIDRMMMALKRAGKLSRLKGLMVGQMTDMHDNTIPFGFTAEEIIHSAVAEYSYPVAFNIPIGHIGTDNIALPLNDEIELHVSDSQTEILI